MDQPEAPVIPAPEILNPSEARARFGELKHAKTGTYMHFDDSETGGNWRPEFGDNGELTGYRLFLRKAPTKTTHWRRK